MCEARGYRLEESSLVKLDNFLGGEHLYYAHFKLRKPGSKEIKGLAQGSGSGQWRWNSSPEPKID